MNFGDGALEHVPDAPLGRAAIVFRSVNRKGEPGYRSDLQRHHLLPCQLLTLPCFGCMLESLGHQRIGFDNFRVNGLLLPCSAKAAIRTGLPLHRGPHRLYSEMVIERVGQVERTWSAASPRAPEQARLDALMRLGLLQRALRRRLLAPRHGSIMLNRHDPLGAGRDFSELDMMAEAIWGATAP